MSKMIMNAVSYCIAVGVLSLGVLAVVYAVFGTYDTHGGM